ncbi:hypothetical protein Dimus_000443, partial [Dionaea muscipula]
DCWWRWWNLLGRSGSGRERLCAGESGWRRWSWAVVERLAEAALLLASGGARQLGTAALVATEAEDG